MQVFRAMMKYYVKGHVHVSLAVAALAVVTFKFFKQEVPLPFVGFVFCGTLVAYGLINRIGAMNWAVEATKGFVFRALKALFLPLSGALFCYGLLPTEIQLTALVFGVLCLFYIVPLRTTPRAQLCGYQVVCCCLCVDRCDRSDATYVCEQCAWFNVCWDGRDPILVGHCVDLAI